MKKIYLLVSLIIIVLFLSGCTNQNQFSNNYDKSTINDASNNDEKEQEDIEYYKDNEMINKFINIFNRLYTIQ